MHVCLCVCACVSLRIHMSLHVFILLFCMTLCRENAKLRTELSSHEENETGLSERNLELQESLNIINSELYNVMTHIVDKHIPRITGLVDVNAKV